MGFALAFDNHLAAPHIHQEIDDLAAQAHLRLVRQLVRFQRRPHLLFDRREKDRRPAGVCEQVGRGELVVGSFQERQHLFGQQPADHPGEILVQVLALHRVGVVGFAPRP